MFICGLLLFGMGLMFGHNAFVVEDRSDELVNFFVGLFMMLLGGVFIQSWLEARQRELICGLEMWFDLLRKDLLKIRQTQDQKSDTKAEVNGVGIMRGLADVFGIESRLIRSMVLSLSIHKIPVLTVQELIKEDSSESFQSVFTNYELHERKESDDESSNPGQHA